MKQFEYTKGPWRVSSYRTDIGCLALYIPDTPEHAHPKWEGNIKIAEAASLLYEALNMLFEDPTTLEAKQKALVALEFAEGQMREDSRKKVYGKT